MRTLLCLGDLSQTGKKTVTEDIIKDLILGDWYFRIENLRGQDYIMVIKGDKEKNLGLYTEISWKTIIKLKGAVFYPEDDF